MRGSSAPDGGLQTLDVQDPCQGEPFGTDAEKQAVKVNGELLTELNVEGRFMGGCQSQDGVFDRGEPLRRAAEGGV